MNPIIDINNMRIVTTTPTTDKDAIKLSELVVEHDKAVMDLMTAIDRANDLKVRLREKQKQMGFIK